MYVLKQTGIESEIVAAVNAKREGLGEQPRAIGVDDVMAAPKAVMYQQACKITQVSRRAGVGWVR